MLDLFLQLQSFLVILLLSVGLAFRKQPKRHLPLMLTALCIDFALVVEVELFRHVLGTLEKIPGNSLSTNIHILVATATALFYIGMVYTGIRLWKGQGHLRKTHRRMGWTTFVLRILTLITSFMASSQP